MRGGPRSPVVAAAASALAACLGCSSSDATPAAASGAPCAEPRFAGAPVGTQCGELVDAEGRVVYLHGVNARVEGIFDVTFDDGRTALEPIPPLDAPDAARMRAMGFNALRLPLSWSALEPTEDGGFDEGYLDRIAAVVELAAGAGVLVLLDLHQDAYSKEIGEDGAPLWAIVPPPTELLEGPLTDLDARRKSSQVLAAFATFFGDSPDGARLRTRFAAAAAHVAARFAGSSGVVGLELFNEPILSTPASLRAFHEEVGAAVRAADPTRLVFFEPDSLRNITDSAPLSESPAPPGWVYAPHVYTLAFTATAAQREAMTEETLAFSNTSARAEAESWGAPLVITEFGYDPAGIKADDYLAWQVGLHDRERASSFFWLWKEESQGGWGLYDRDASTGAWTERDHVRRALARVTAEAVAGWPTRLGYDRAARRFEVAFRGDGAITAPNRLFVPGSDDFAAAFEVRCDGAAVAAARDPASGIVEVACGGPGDHVLELSAR